MSSAPKSSSLANPYSPPKPSAGPSDAVATTHAGGSASPALPLNRYFTFLALAGAGCGLDLWTKHAVFRWRGIPRLNNQWWLIDGRFGIETSLNPGALFGMGAGFWWVFALLSVVALVGITTWLFVYRAANDRWITVALGLVSGGILGNLYDRLGLDKLPDVPAEFAHSVRDWILFVWPEVKLQIFDPWPNFNIADTLLVTGAIMLVVHAIVWQEADRPKAKTA